MNAVVVSAMQTARRNPLAACIALLFAFNAPAAMPGSAAGFGCRFFLQFAFTRNHLLQLFSGEL